MKEIHDHSMSWPRSSMQQSVLSRLGRIQPPGHHLLFAAGIEIRLFYWPQDCQDDSWLWTPREDLLQEAVLSWLHLLRHCNAKAHNFQYFLIFNTFLYTLGTVLKSCAWSNCWGYTLKLMREPAAELGADSRVLRSPLCCPFAEWCQRAGPQDF